MLPKYVDGRMTGFLAFGFPVRSLQFLCGHICLLAVWHEQSGADGPDRHRGTVDKQHDRQPGTSVRDHIMLHDRRDPGADELHWSGNHRQLHIRTRVFGVHVSVGHSHHRVTAEGPDWCQGRWRESVENDQGHSGAHWLHKRRRHGHGSHLHSDRYASEGKITRVLHVQNTTIIIINIGDILLFLCRKKILFEKAHNRRTL